MQGDVLKKSRAFMYCKARPLDMAGFQYHFENGSKEMVMNAIILSIPRFLIAHRTLIGNWMAAIPTSGRSLKIGGRDRVLFKIFCT